MSIILKMLKPAANLLSSMRRKRDSLKLDAMIARGLRIGKNVYINENVFFDYSHPYLIEIQDNCRISAGVRFLAHDATTFRKIGVTRVAPVRILEGSFIGEHAIILPGVTIGPNALIAAGAVVNRNIGEDMCAVGNPAKPYGKYSKLIERYCKEVTEEEIFDITALENGELSINEVRRMCEAHGTMFFKGLSKNDPHYLNIDFNALVQEQKEALATLWQIKMSRSQAVMEGTSDVDQEPTCGFPTEENF